MDKSHSKLTQHVSKLTKDIADTLENAAALSKVIHSDGWRFPEAQSLDCIDYAMNDWQVPENSVIVASFPKTGQAYRPSSNMDIFVIFSWFENILLQIIWQHTINLERFSN